MFIRTIIIKIVIVFAFALSPKIVQAQGTIFLSNLGLTSAGSVSVGSDSWFAANFISGNNPSGYFLNSVQLAMTDVSGNPSAFMVMLYGEGNDFGAILPGSNLGTLNGSLDPVTGGIYIYTPGSSLILSPNTDYFIVVTAESAVDDGAYKWSVTSTPSSGYTSYHWGREIFFADSSDGLNWNYTSGIYGQFALNATDVPEPSAEMLLGGGGILLLGFTRWKAMMRS